MMHSLPAGPLLEQPAARVAHLGIDEHRRGRARFAVDEQTGEYTTANLAIAVGFVPDGVQAAYNLASKDVEKVGGDCKGLGY